MDTKYKVQLMFQEIRMLLLFVSYRQITVYIFLQLIKIHIIYEDKLKAKREIELDVSLITLFRYLNESEQIRKVGISANRGSCLLL